jgi:Double-GTPase 1
MIQRIFNLFGQNNPQQGTVEFRIVGDRSSGKTTYLAALAYWPISLVGTESPIHSVEPYEPDSRVLLDMAENILLQGDDLPPTEEPILYSLTVKLKQKFVEKLTGKPPSIRISCVDYPGEFFANIRKNTSIVDSYLDDLQAAAGLLLLIDGTKQTTKDDQNNAKAIKILEKRLNQRLANTPDRLKNYRIAVVISKAEDAIIWASLDNVPNFMQRKFPETQGALNQWKTEWKCQIEYFSCSALGWMGTRREPNTKVIQRDPPKAILRDSNVWKPEGLVQPIFWLQTGYRHSELTKHNL